MNSFGEVFRVSLFGESHGNSIGVVIDGCPPGLSVDAGDFVPDLSRRQSGRKGSTVRHEGDKPEILSGIFNGRTTGSPITVVTRNSDKISSDYDEFRKAYLHGENPVRELNAYTLIFRHCGYLLVYEKY